MGGPPPAPAPAPAPAPVPNATTSFWRAHPAALDTHRSTPALPSTADVVVIGAGYAGASTVHHLLELSRASGRAPPPSIVVLEAREACSGATGRNGGHLKPDPYNRPASLAQTHGAPAAAEVANFEAAHIPALKRLVESDRANFPDGADFVLTRCLDVMLTDDVHARMAAGVELLSKHAEMSDGVLKDVQELSAADAERLSGVRGARACFSYTAAHLSPYKLVLGLLSRALAHPSGAVNLQTHTPVVAVAAAPDAEGYVAVTTRDRGVVRAKKVVYATNAYTAALLPAFAGRVVPVRGICSHIAVPEAARRRPPPLLQTSYILRWGAVEYEYLIPRLDGSIVVGGGRSKYYADRAQWYDNVSDDALIEPAKAHFDGYMQRLFHGWEDSGAETSKVWTGIMGYSADGAPFIGPVPGRPNQFVLAGFSGHGMPQVFLSAKGVAEMVLDDAATFASTGIPRVFEATKARLDNPRNTILESWEASRQTPPAKL